LTFYNTETVTIERRAEIDSKLYEISINPTDDYLVVLSVF
jgi:hypothetical protein